MHTFAGSFRMIAPKLLKGSKRKMIEFLNAEVK